MQWQRSYPLNEANRRMAAEPVSVPKDHEGVGNALRSAYQPRVTDTPQELWELLERLN